MVKRLLIWWANSRIDSTYRDLNQRLRDDAIGADYLANQLEHVDRLERRVIALSS